MRFLDLLICAIALSVLGILTPDAAAQPKQVKTINEWRGSVADPATPKGIPEVIVSMKELEKLWKDLAITDKMPMIDFTKEFAVIGTTVGSRIDLTARLDDNGNLEINGIVTLDLVPGFRYVIASVSRDGVKTVNKKELPK